MPPGSFPVGRRPVIAATAVLVAGCDALPGATSDPTPSAPSPAISGDDALTARVREDLAESAALAAAIARRVPGLDGLAGPFVALHRAHGALLGDLPDVAAPRIRRKQARRDLLRRERRLQDQLVQAAVAAESGALAQSLAAMAAAVAQQHEASA